MQKREIIILKRKEVSTIVSSWPFDKPQFGFIKIVRDTISCDCEDGGSYYSLIIKKVSNNKYFKIDYQGWDIDNGFEDFDDEVKLEEVFPKTIETIIYE